MQTYTACIQALAANKLEADLHGIWQELKSELEPDAVAYESYSQSTAFRTTPAY